MVTPTTSVSLSSPAANPEVLIYLEDVWKVFRTPAGEFEALRGIHLAVRHGEFVSITGKSGSGKSTLVNMITGIDRPTRGTVRVNSTLLNALREGQLSVWRGHNLGIVFQFFQLLPMLSVLENVMLPMDFCNRYDPAEREERAMALLRRVGLEAVAHKLPAALSGGQQQCAAIARALANDPPILVADEPTGNLDSRTAERVMEIFLDLVAHGKTLVMVTHDLSLARRAHRILVIVDGELIHAALAAALPDLNHSLLRQLNRLVRPVNLPPGASLPACGWVVVLRGVLQPAGHRLFRRAPIQAGEARLLTSGWLSGTLFAGPQGAEVLCIPAEALQPLLTTHSDLAQAMRGPHGGQA